MSQIDIPFVAVHNQGLEIKKITKSYNNKRILDNVSINLNRGESVALLGPNGAGKTTLFYTMMGLIKPDNGSILLDKNDISISENVTVQVVKSTVQSLLSRTQIKK